MAHTMSLEEFARLVQTEPSELEEWVAAGLLDPTRTGRFEELDVLRLLHIRERQALGYSADEVAQGLAKGELEPFLGEYLYPRGEQLSLEEAAKRLDVDAELLSALRTALGWRREGFLESDVQLIESFKAIAAAGMPREALLEGARVFGDALRRLAETEVRLVHVHIHERLVEEGLAEQDVVRGTTAIEQVALPLLDGIVKGVHHEHFLQALIEDAFVHLVDPEAAGGRGSVDATIAFIDVESFTQLAETEGDQTAMETMTRVDSIVRGLVLDHHGKVVKQIGDALMLAFRQPAEAVAFAAELHDAVRDDRSIPPLRIGMHSGPAIYRAGDYIGSTVNLASRVTSTATAGQTVLTEAVADALDDTTAVEPIGVRMLRGAARPVQLYRLAQLEARRDPTCGRIVEAPPVATLREGDEELWFCSQQCLRDYLGAERAAV
jgi:adenylate cyclase